MYHTSLFLLKESIYKNHLKIEDHLQRPIYPLSPVSYWPTKPSYVLAHQAQFCTGSSSPILSSPPSLVSYWPTMSSSVLAQQVQFRTGPPSPISYWPNKPSSVLVHQAQICTGPPNPVSYWPPILA